MGMLIKLIGTPIVTLLDKVAALKISWVPLGVLILGAVVYFGFWGSFALLEKTAHSKEDEAELGKIFIKQICLVLNCALISIFVTEFPGESFMLSSLGEGMTVSNFSEWNGIPKFFFWCAIINIASMLFTQVFLSKRGGIILSIILTWASGVALGHALIPLIVWLHDDVSMLFAIVLPLAEGLAIGAMYFGSVFGIIPLDIAEVLAKHTVGNRNNTYNGPSAAELWAEVDASRRKAAEEARNAYEPPKPKVEVTRRDGFFVETLKVSNDGERYYDPDDGEWHKVDDIGK